MSRLSELLKSEISFANSANRANPVDSNGGISKISKGVSENSRLPSDLEVRIQAMARRWQYSQVEIALVLALATVDPLGWERVVSLDEGKFGLGRERPLQ